ncbi:tail fiber protein [Morganella morganii]|nr:tail fiber protein [Morganella morganii]MDE2538695.1 tail fiber protein [Morganella morganii]
MSANQGYIVYFLRAMQQWMTDTGQVEIELPNGQKVTLDSVKAMSEAIANAKPGDATTSQKGIVQLTEKIGDSETLVPHQKAVRDGINALNSSIGKGLSINDNGYTEIYPSDKNKAGLWQRINTSVFEVLSGSTGKFSVANDSVKIGGTIDVKTNTPGNDQSRVEITSPDGRFSIGMWGYNDGRTLVSCRNTSGWSNVSFANVGSGSAAVIGGNIYVDGSGYIKKSSPIIQIYPDGNYDTNDESEGAEVRRTGNGQYHITGILGYNSDGAWGVNGGISVPKDNNGLELVYIDDRVQSDGSLIIETCHRQHAHLPERFQNWRLKEVTPEGERIFWQDGELCDLPESTRLDVRVEMPQDSVWNIKQRELAEQMDREQAERDTEE